MSKIEDLQINIKRQQIGATQRRVLVVEGDDDKQAFSAWLAKIFALWENQWVVAAAESKSNVLKLLAREPDWVGVTDRDEWTSEIIEQKQQTHPNLWVLPRYCLENYLCDPDELWAMLPLGQQQKIPGGSVELSNAITEHLALWRQHGTLWQVVNPLWEGLRALGFKEKLLDIDHSGDDETIKDTLNAWHQHLDPVQIWNKYQQRLAEVTAWQVKRQLSELVHGKRFFPAVVHQVLSHRLGQLTANQLQNNLLQLSIPPADLLPLWQRMELVA